MKAKLFIIGSILMFFSSCTMLNYSRIEIRNDEIKKEKNVHLKGWHNRTVEWSTPLNSLSRHFYKKTNQKGVSEYYVYEVLKFNITSMPINDTIYLIADNEILPVRVEKLEIFAKMERTPINEDIETSDSTKTTVITGYNEEYKQIQKIKYQLHEKEIRAIKNCKNLKFRYYSEPEMMTIILRAKHLKKLKQFISI